MATKPYQEGLSWSFRLRLKGQSIYRTGFASSASASREANRLRQSILETGKPKHNGPHRTTLAQAMTLYAKERLPSLKGAPQDARRINRYLRTLKLDTIGLTEPATPGKDEASAHYWDVVILPTATQRKIPNSLRTHRQHQAERGQETDRRIRHLANMPVAEIMTYHVQDLIDTMIRDGYEPASIGLERALLRQVFNYARKSWLWTEPARNPATSLALPKIDNARDRVVTNAEWQKIVQELNNETNPFIAPAVALLLETAMRVSEPLLHARWQDLNWGQCTLSLSDAKAGPRTVPLNPAAMSILTSIKNIQGNATPEARILPITYETIKAGWRRACKAAHISDVRIHDLRHTAATRFALELKGNLPVLKIITGHKTYSQLNRYINVKPEDVARLLHNRPLTEDNAPAGLHLPKPKLVVSETGGATSTLPNNVIPLYRPADQSPQKQLPRR